MKSRYPSKPRVDRNLVADQPAKFVIFSGLLIAFVIGLTLRGLISPQKIEAMVHSAAGRIHRDVKVSFDTAEFSLSEHGWPRLAVVIHRVKLESSRTCWGQPELLAEKIVLPISLISTIFERRPVKRIQGQDVSLILRSNMSPCESGEESVITSPNAEPPHQQAVRLTNRKKEPEVNFSTLVDELEVDHLQVVSIPSGHDPVEFGDLNLVVKSHQPKVMELSAKTHFLRDPAIHDYASHGQIDLEFKEFPEKEISAQLSGHWREGNYKLAAKLNPDTMQVVASADLKHIPAAQVISALREYGWLREDLNGRKMWVTLKGESQGNIREWQKMPLSISNFRVEGDVGEIEVAAFSATQLKPFVFKPMMAEIKSLNIDRLLEFMRRPRSLKFLGQLGEFTGRFELLSEDKLKLSGEHKDLEFIFSNRGQTQVQRVSSIAGDMRLENNRWILNMKNLSLEDGQFRGQMEVTADRDFRVWDVQLTADELKLSGRVQKLMSGGGELAPVQSQVKVKIKDGQVQLLKGFLKSPLIEVDKIRFEKFQTRFDLEQEAGSLNLQARSLELKSGSRGQALVSGALKGLGSAPALFSDISGTFMLRQKEIQWKNLALTLGDRGRLVSQGQWNSEGFLSGQIQGRIDKKMHRWKLAGHRDEPSIVEINDIQTSRF